MPRPPKYATEEERKAARREQDRERWHRRKQDEEYMDKKREDKARWQQENAERHCEHVKAHYRRHGRGGVASATQPTTAARKKRDTGDAKLKRGT